MKYLFNEVGGFCFCECLLCLGSNTACFNSHSVLCVGFGCTPDRLHLSYPPCQVQWCNLYLEGPAELPLPSRCLHACVNNILFALTLYNLTVFNCTNRLALVYHQKNKFLPEIKQKLSFLAWSSGLISFS